MLEPRVAHGDTAAETGENHQQRAVTPPAGCSRIVERCGQRDHADGDEGIALQDAHRARFESLCVLEIQPEADQSAADQENPRVNPA